MYHYPGEPYKHESRKYIDYYVKQAQEGRGPSQRNLRCPTCDNYSPPQGISPNQVEKPAVKKQL